ncbi:MAG: hypothetical protein K2J99_14795 [Lachnospiraceae bacterium]|nr:hypothetical protein [Lachnospiraceae bacterium]
MGKKDIGLKAYLQNAVRYADLWNGAVFKGKQIIKAEELQEITPVHSKSDQDAILERTGDLVMKQNHDGQRFVILALENQEEIDYGMPVRIMMQEALEYDRQIKAIKRENERAYKRYCKEKNSGLQTMFYKDSGEYLYKIRKKDYICPVMTLVLYWGEDEWKGAKSLHEMIDFDSMDLSMSKELKKIVPEYPLHFLNLSDFEHFEYFRTELRPLFEMFCRRNNKEDFMKYIKTSKKCWSMDDESWYMLGQLTDSKDIQSLIRQKGQSNQQKGRNKGMCKAIEDLKNEGKAEGKAEAIIVLLKEYGVLSKRLESKILKQTNLPVLDEWFMLAIHTRSVEEFVQQSHIEI